MASGTYQPGFLQSLRIQAGVAIYNNLQSTKERMKLQDASSEERVAFAKKVYGIVGLQMLMTSVMCFAAISSQAFLSVLANPALLLLSMIGMIVVTIIFVCSKSMRSTVPHNYALLLAFTLFEGHLTSLVCAVYDPETVALAAILTGGMVLVLTGYALTTNKDFTFEWKIILTLLVASLVVGISRLFVASSAMEMLSCFLGILIGSYYVLYDTQMIFGGQRRAFDIDDYILAALNIYLDIIQLFIKILRLLDQLKEKKKK